MLNNLTFDLPQWIGMISLTLGILCFAQKDDHRLKVIMVLMCCSNSVHFWLLGAQTAFITSVLTGFRTFFSIKYPCPWLGVVFMVVTFFWGLWVSDSWPDMFPVLGSCIGTYAVFFLSGLKMRLAFLVGALCWLTNNILVGSIGTTILESILVIVNITTIIRLIRSPLPDDKSVVAKIK